MSAFALDPRLAADSELLAVIDQIEVRTMRRVPWPWLLLVPRVAGASECFDLDAAGQAALWQLTLALAQGLKHATAADKINIGALGNVVAQLHVHIVARHRTDPAWPAPVWGRSEAPIDETAEEARRETLRALVDQISRSMPGRASAASQP